jgi:putative cardiolipin synthase
MERGEQALIARAWLADHAQHSIDVQYFIWSTDNVGIIAAEALLRAADRGVRVRIIVDDILIDASASSLLALDKHSNIEIRIYNPKRAANFLNPLTSFRGINQRMHNKLLVVDGLVAITGGRNVADEYYDFDHEYNFRDRDALLVGDVVGKMEASFGLYWQSDLSVSVEELHGDRLTGAEIQDVYRKLHGYAKSPANFAPAVRAAIDDVAAAFPRLAAAMRWGAVDYLSDRPGKNDNRLTLEGGGITTAALARLVEGAKQRIVIQSPYLVLSDKAKELFRRTKARGVRVRISTNSLSSTDNLQVAAGYRNQRDEMLKMGLEIYEFRPDPREQLDLMRRFQPGKGKRPVFGLHAKTMVVDSKTVFIGTFNLDPRSENLNTEVGVVIHDETVARAVEAAIEADMAPGNSWSAARDNPDQYVPRRKLNKVRFWQLTPIRPLL